jgi:hypothetical protein
MSGGALDTSGFIWETVVGKGYAWSCTGHATSTIVRPSCCWLLSPWAGVSSVPPDYTLDRSGDLYWACAIYILFECCIWCVVRCRTGYVWRLMSNSIAFSTFLHIWCCTGYVWRLMSHSIAFLTFLSTVSSVALDTYGALYLPKLICKILCLSYLCTREALDHGAL